MVCVIIFLCYEILLSLNKQCVWGLAKRRVKWRVMISESYDFGEL